MDLERPRGLGVERPFEPDESVRRCSRWGRKSSVGDGSGEELLRWIGDTERERPVRMRWKNDGVIIDDVDPAVLLRKKLGEDDSVEDVLERW